jgi:probable HAF family extracellular repeat protein
MAFLLALDLSAAEFTISDIGTGTAYDINSAGKVAASIEGLRVVFDGRETTPIVVPDFPSLLGACTALSDAGWVGLYCLDANGEWPRLFAWDLNTGSYDQFVMYDSKPLSVLTAINSSGATAGSMSGSDGDYLYLFGVYRAQGVWASLEGSGSSGFNDINESGAMAGSLSTTGMFNIPPVGLPGGGIHWHPRRACLFVDMQSQLIDQRPNPVYSTNEWQDWYRDDWSDATCVNSHNWVGGWSRETLKGARHAFLYQGQEMQDLGTLGGSESVALDLNDDGVVVGWANTSTGTRHAFIYRNGTMADLNDAVAPGSGWVLEEAVAINAYGQIAGNGTYEGVAHAFLLNPEGIGFAPGITSQPSGSGIYPIGSSLTLSVAASGDGPLTYQWLQDGAALAGETSDTLTITNLQKVNGGHYTVRVSNDYGSVVSAAVVVEVPDAILEIAPYAGIWIHGELGATYRLEYKARVGDATWDSLPGTVTVSTIPQFHLDASQPMSSQRVYRAVRVE